MSSRTMEPPTGELPGVDNYVSHMLKTTKTRPPITWQNFLDEVNWLNMFLLTAIPVMGIIGAYHTKLRWETAVFAVFYYFFTGLGITAGYHRLWAHRCYNAGTFLQYLLALAGAGAAQGSIKWWSRGHRSHHRYTDTKLDPYNATEGFWHSHIGWLLMKPRIRQGPADVSDLKKSALVRWQHKNFLIILPIMAFLLPTLIAWIGWSDARGGYIYAGLIRLTFVHHSTFCVNSLAHWIGETPFDDKHTPKDHMITAFVTIGEGYHNFHHQFPMDYRNAIKWYQYDPTKWFISVCAKLGLASHLKTFSANEIRKGQLTMQLKHLRKTQESLAWPSETDDLPVVTWDAYQAEATKRPVILVSGFIHDLSSFLDEHPGGAPLLVKFVGKDATAAFFGGVYEHSNAAHNLLAMKRVGILHGGIPHALDDKAVPPSQRLKIARYTELATSSSERDSSERGSSATYSDGEGGLLGEGEL